MAEETPAEKPGPEYRGGAPEDENAKQGAGTTAAEGIVTDNETPGGTPPDDDDPQAMSSDALGDFPDSGHDAADSIDLSAGDNADATSQGHSGGARGSEAGLGRHEDAEVDEDNPDQTLDD
jgi:hypothetical protein